MDKRLQLQADLKNNISPKLKQIGKDLQEVRRTPGMEQVDKWFSGFNTSAEGFTKGGASVAGIMSSIGVGGLTAAASLAEMVKQFKELGDHAFAVKKLGQETGLTIDQVRRWEYVGQVFRVPVEQMDAALKTLGDQMVDFRRQRGHLFGQLNNLDPKFAEKLQLEDTQHQLQDIFSWLSKIPDAAARNRWAKEFFGSEDVDALLTNGFPALNQAIQDAARNVSPLTEEMQKQADAYNASLVQFNQTWDNFKTQVGPFVFDQLKKAVDDFKDVFDEIKAAFGWLQRAKDDPAGTAKQLGDAVDKAFDDKTQEVGDRWRRGIQALKDARDAAKSEDGNALHRNDTAPLDWIAKEKAAGRSLLHRSAFEDDDRSSLRRNIDFRDDDGSSAPAANGFGQFGLVAVLAEGTKVGVLAAFREWAQEQSVGESSGGGGGLIKASFESNGPGGGAGVGGGGFPTRGGVGLLASAGILDMIRQGETGTLGPESYKTITSQWHGDRPDVTKMTVDQVLAFQHEMLSKGVTDSAVGGFQINGTTLEDFKNRMHLSGSELFDPEMQTRIAKEIFGSTGGSIGALRGRWASLNKQSDAAIRGAVGNGLGTGAGPGAPAGASVPGHIGGQMQIGDQAFRFGSGGQGNSSIPFGDYPITPDAIGAWGRSHGAIGINNNGIYDQALKRMRTGIELHAGHSAELFTEGCVAFEAQQWPKVKSAVLGMIKREGHAYLHVGKDGARITPLPSLVDEARRSSGSDPASVSGSIEAHVHLHEGRIRGATASGSGAVAPPKVHLDRGPTMTQPSYEA